MGGGGVGGGGGLNWSTNREITNNKQTTRGIEPTLSAVRMYACRIPLLFPKSWVCVCVWVGGSVGRRVDVQARVVYVSE